MPHLASEPLRWTTREDTDLRGTLAPLPSPAWFGNILVYQEKIPPEGLFTSFRSWFGTLDHQGRHLTQKYQTQIQPN